MFLHGRLLVDPASPPRLGWVEIAQGRIVRLGAGRPPALPSAGDDDCLICPGFIDAHLHLPQFECVGCDGLELMDWLKDVIYPAEMRWGDGRVANAQISECFRRLLAAGTLGSRVISRRMRMVWVAYWMGFAAFPCAAWLAKS